MVLAVTVVLILLKAKKVIDLRVTAGCFWCCLLREWRFHCTSIGRDGARPLVSALERLPNTVQVDFVCRDWSHNLGDRRRDSGLVGKVLVVSSRNRDEMGGECARL